MGRIVIYGGELAGVAAALSAARRAPAGTTVTLIFPEPLPGGTTTAGALCAWESRPWTHNGRRAEPQGGNYGIWREALGPVYRPAALARHLAEDLAEAGVEVLAGAEIDAVLPQVAPGARRPRPRSKRAGAMATVGTLHLRPVVPGQDGSELGPEVREVTADMFIDASATGRLARLAGLGQSVGRADWNEDARQMAATLLFAVENVDWDEIVAARDAAERPIWGTATAESPDGMHRSFWGAAQLAATDPVLAAFAAAHQGCRLGGPHGWEEAGGVFWLSALLVYHVDGRRRAWDAGTPRDPEPVPLLSRDQDSACREARALAVSSDLLGALRRFPGLGRARLAGGDEPAVASALLLRESVHTKAAGPDDFAVRVRDCSGAGTGPDEGTDARCHARRIGLGFYWMENVGYTPGETVGTTAVGTNPVYLPLDAILVPPVSNLLVPGYAARVDGRAWWSLRTAPNLCVLGDAAGVAAAFALHEGIGPLRFGVPEIAALQSWLAGEGAILDKW